MAIHSLIPMEISQYSQHKPSRSKLEKQKTPEKRKKDTEEQDEENTPIILGGYKARLEAKWRERERNVLQNLVL